MMVDGGDYFDDLNQQGGGGKAPDVRQQSAAAFQQAQRRRRDQFNPEERILLNTKYHAGPKNRLTLMRPTMANLAKGQPQFVPGNTLCR